jgi:hypothetical protein
MEVLLLACCLASLCAVLLAPDAPRTSVSLDGLAMVGTMHALNMFDVLSVSHDPLVQALFSLPCAVHRRRLACLYRRLSSRRAGAHRRVPKHVVALFPIAAKSTRDHPITVRSSHSVGVDECPVVEPLAGAMRRSTGLRPAVAPPNLFVPVLAVCCRSAFVPWCPLCRRTHRRRSRTSPRASFAALPFLWGNPSSTLCALLFLEPYLAVNLALSCLTVSTYGHRSRNSSSPVQLCRAADVAHRRTRSTVPWASSNPTEYEEPSADLGKSSLGECWAFQPMEAL